VHLKIKKILIIFSLVTLISTIFILGISKKKRNRINILTSFYPVYIATINITDKIDDIEVSNLSCSYGQQCLHDFSLKTSDIKQIEDSDAFIINGSGMEPFVDKLLNKSKVIDSSKGIKILTDEHGEQNPYVWLSVDNHIKQVKNISSELCEIFPRYCKEINKNSENYVQKLKKLMLESEKLQFSGKVLLALNNKLEYLTNSVGLKTIILLPKHNHDDSLSLRNISEAVGKIKKYNIKFVISTDDSHQKNQELIFNETNISDIKLSLITEGDGSADSYLNNMIKNFEILNKALSQNV